MYEIREANHMVEESMRSLLGLVYSYLEGFVTISAMIYAHMKVLLHNLVAGGLDLDASSSKALVDSLDHALVCFFSLSIILRVVCFYTNYF